MRYRRGVEPALAGHGAPTRPRGTVSTGKTASPQGGRKLAAVHASRSEARLLNTYDAKRRPVAWLRHNQIFAHDDYKAYGDASAPAEEIIDDVAMELGQLYRSAALPDLGPELPAAPTPDECAGRPGTRAPHVWLDRHRSTLDAFGRRWTLVTSSETWRSATDDVRRELGTRVEILCAAAESEVSGSVTTTYGLGAGGAALVQPDGYIAWRAVRAPTSRTAALTAALTAAAMAVPRPSAWDDHAAIVDLTARYADAINRGWNGKAVQPGAISQIFTARRHLPSPGCTADQRGSRDRGCPAPDAAANVPFTMHTFLNPVLVVDGDTAAGEWLMWLAADGDDGARAAYLGADIGYVQHRCGLAHPVDCHHARNVPTGVASRGAGSTEKTSC